MAGGLMQLVAYGAQDLYLTGNPQIIFLRWYIGDNYEYLPSGQRQTTGKVVFCLYNDTVPNIASPLPSQKLFYDTPMLDRVPPSTNRVFTLSC